MRIKSIGNRVGSKRWGNSKGDDTESVENEIWVKCRFCTAESNGNLQNFVQNYYPLPFKNNVSTRIVLLL